MNIITAREIGLIGRRLNNKKPLNEVKALHKEAEEEGVRVTPEQAVKGYAWLMDQYKTPRGIERKNNPFGYREEEALDSGLDHFTYDGHYDAGNTPAIMGLIKNILWWGEKRIFQRKEAS